MADKFLKTYIKGFDEELGGGIPEGHVILLAGTPGTLKSTTAYHMAFRNAKNEGMKVLYISLDKNKEKLMDQMSRLGMDNAEGAIVIYDLATIKTNLSHFKGLNWWEPFRTHVKDLKYTFNFNLLILDSLQMLETVVKIGDVKAETHTIFKWIEDELKVTGILISEMSFDSDRFSRYDEEIISDGIIYLSMTETETGVERRIRCVKMMSIPHNTNYFRLFLRDNEPWAEKIGLKKQTSTTPLPSTDSYSF